MHTKLLLTKISYVILSTVGIDTQQTDWRIRHPRKSVTHTENSMTIFPNTGHLSRYLPHLMQYSGAWIGSQRIRPRCALSVGHCLAATRSAFSKHTEKALTMLYTFLIAQRGQRLAQVRTRTISAIAQNETKAREQLQGLPLVFVRCTPTKGAAA